MQHRYNLEELERIATYAEASGLFNAGQKLTKSQAMMRLLRGQEIGLPPTVALGGIWFSRGKMVLDAALTGTLLRQAGYQLRAVVVTDEEVRLELLREDSVVGTAAFVLADAQRAGLVKPGGAWTAYPQDMLWARCVTRLARRYAPEVFGGAVYGPGEIVDGDDDVEEATVVRDQEHIQVLLHRARQEAERLGLPIDAIKEQILLRCEVPLLRDIRPSQGMMQLERYVAELAGLPSPGDAESSDTQEEEPAVVRMVPEDAEEMPF